MSTFVSPMTRWKFGYKVSQLRSIIYLHEQFIESMKNIRQTLDTYIAEIDVGRVLY